MFENSKVTFFACSLPTCQRKNKKNKNEFLAHIPSASEESGGCWRFLSGVFEESGMHGENAECERAIE